MMELGFNEVLIAGTPTTGVILDSETDICEARINGEFVCCHRLAAVCERELRRRGVRLEAQPVQLPAEPVTVTERQARPRCEFYRAIKRCFAIFQEVGLPTDDAGMRRELSRLLGKTVGSRRDLQASEWTLAGDLAKRAVMAR